MARKIKQIVVVTDVERDYVYSLCEDGTVWSGCFRQYVEKDGTKKSVWCWDEIPGVPDAKE
jgi:hypothetical protein